MVLRADFDLYMAPEWPAQWGVYKGHYDFWRIRAFLVCMCISKGRNRPSSALKIVWHPKSSFLAKNWPFFGKIATFCTKSQKHLFVLAKENLVFSGPKIVKLV